MTEIKKVFHKATFAFAVISTFLYLQMVHKPMENNENVFKLIRGSLPGNDSLVIEILRKHFLVSPSSLPYNFSSDPNYRLYRHRGTWPYINFYLKQFFSNQSDGFFVEAGALDGEMLSNSLWLEKNLGWKGLLIESDKDSYKKLLRKNRRAWSSNSCLSTSDHTKETVHVQVRRNPEYDGDGVAWYFEGASHELGVTISPRYNPLFQRSDSYYSVVQCFPLASYLIALNVTKVDLLSLDIQGTEESVLRSFPWEDITVSVIVVEVSSESYKDIKAYMESVGYIPVNAGEAPPMEDLIFVRKDELDNLSLKFYRETNHLPGP